MTDERKENASRKHLFSVELVELRLAVVLAPQTQHLCLGTVRHVDELLKPPTFTDSTRHAPQNQTVVTHLDRYILQQLQPFYGSLDYVRGNPGEPVPEGTFRNLLDFLAQNEHNTGRCTNNLDGLPPHPD